MGSKIVGVVKLNEKIGPCIQIVLDTASGRSEGEIVLLDELYVENRTHYVDIFSGKLTKTEKRK